MAAAAVWAVIMVEKLLHRGGPLGARAVRVPPSSDARRDHVPAHQRHVLVTACWSVYSHEPGACRLVRVAHWRDELRGELERERESRTRLAEQQTDGTWNGGIEGE
jgi:hypothetical protein